MVARDPKTIGTRELERRSRFFTVAIALIFILLVGQLTNLQFLQGAKWAEAADINRIRIVPVAAPRGMIVDRRGVVLASNRPSYTVTLFYTGEKTLQPTVHLLAQILAGDAHTPEVAAKEQEIWQKFLYHKKYVGLYKPLRVETNIGPEIYTKLEEHKTDLPGVDVTLEPIRSYPVAVDTSPTPPAVGAKAAPVPATSPETPADPSGADIESMAAHVIGYVGQISEAQLTSDRYKGYQGGDVIGKSGLEDYYEPYLKGEEGTRPVQVDHLGRWFADLPGGTDPVPGDNLTLTLDSELQRVAEQTLAAKIHEFQTRPDSRKASAGAVVVEDVRTGEILAMASYPSFDLNWWVGGISSEHWNVLNTDPHRPMMDYAISAFAPGSTFKMVTAAGALQEDRITPDFTIVDNGVYWLWQKPKDWKKGGHGIVNLHKAIAESCDTYFYEAGRLLTVDGLGKYSHMFGFGQPTGIDLYGEAKGSDASRDSYNRTLKGGKVTNDWQLGDTLSQAIGQGRTLVTPLQLANYVATLANGGTRYRPHLVTEIRTASGELVKSFGAEALSKVDVSPENLRVVREGMLGAAQWGGTASGSFGAFPIKVGAKTGTAETSTGVDNGVFVAFAPYDNPEIAISVLVVGGGHGTFAAEVARPVLAQYFGIPDSGASVPVRAD
ncbi:MAG: penicillin-binding protein 2 [Firmicutes bacterium]|nr:penicillin-binding protein 2 [Bacillota bacterium]